jgi:hypothetical protein
MSGAMIDRRIAYVVEKWQECLPLMQVTLDREDSPTCMVCPRYAAEVLKLDEYVHEPLHQLIADSFTVVEITTAKWARDKMGVSRNELRFTTHGLEFESSVPYSAKVDVEAFYRDAGVRMTRNLGSRRVTIATALGLHVEPRARRVVALEMSTEGF